MSFNNERKIIEEATEKKVAPQEVDDEQIGKKKNNPLSNYETTIRNFNTHYRLRNQQNRGMKIVILRFIFY